MKKLLLFIALLCVGISAHAQCASPNVTDTFTGSGGLGSNWTDLFTSNYSTLQKTSGVVTPVGSAAAGVAIYTGVTYGTTICADFTVSADLHSDNITGPAIVGPGGGYFWMFQASHVIFKLDSTGGGAGSAGVSCPTGGGVVGDILSLSLNTSTGALTCTLNHGGTITSSTGTDTSYSTGLSAGILVDQRSNPSDAVSLFHASGALTSPSMTASPAFAVTSTVGSVISLLGSLTSWTAGTPGTPTLTVSGVSGTSKTAQSCTDSTHCTITLTTGSTTGTLTITDPSGGTTTIGVNAPQTWYIRSDGGTRYSANATSGQCDGLADVSYASTGGTGTNQHCAFNDYRFLWDDQSYNNDAWVISGGDTVIIRGGPWGVGHQNLAYNTPGDPWCLGGGTTGCANPGIPAGTVANPTRILGENYANCSTAGEGFPGGFVDKTKVTQLYGQNGLGQTINLSGAKNVVVKCIEVTQHGHCLFYPSGNPDPCQSSGTNIADWNSDGVSTSPETENVLVEDFWTHGHQARGFKGPFKSITCNRCLISDEAYTGWDFDDGTGSHSGQGTAFPEDGAMWTFTNSVIEFSGCKEEYPIAHAIPIQVGGCYDQTSGGQGDGVGGPQLTGLSSIIDHAIFRYNTQDGLDLGHTDTGRIHTLSITNSQMYGNMGGGYKWGGAYEYVKFTNNTANLNCMRMGQPLTGAPTGYNNNLSNFCRAGDGFPFDFHNGSLIDMYNNSIVTYAPTTFDVDCWEVSDCSTAVVNFYNNIVRGYDNPNTYTLGGQAGGPGVWALQHTERGYTVNRGDNIYYATRTGTALCPTAYTGETCGDPLFTSEPATYTTEAALDNYNFTLSSTSPAIAAGTRNSVALTDFTGASRNNPTALGAFEYFVTSVVRKIFPSRHP